MKISFTDYLVRMCEMYYSFHLLLNEIIWLV